MTQRRQVARRRTLQRHPPGDALDVGHPGQPPAKVQAYRVLVDQKPDGVLTADDLVTGQQRGPQPAA